MGKRVCRLGRRTHASPAPTSTPLSPSLPACSKLGAPEGVSPHAAGHQRCRPSLLRWGGIPPGLCSVVPEGSRPRACCALPVVQGSSCCRPPTLPPRCAAGRPAACPNPTALPGHALHPMQAPTSAASSATPSPSCWSAGIRWGTPLASCKGPACCAPSAGCCAQRCNRDASPALLPGPDACLAHQISPPCPSGPHEAPRQSLAHQPWPALRGLFINAHSGTHEVPHHPLLRPNPCPRSPSRSWRRSTPSCAATPTWRPSGGSPGCLARRTPCASATPSASGERGAGTRGGGIPSNTFAAEPNRREVHSNRARRELQAGAYHIQDGGHIANTLRQQGDNTIAPPVCPAVCAPAPRLRLT